MPSHPITLALERAARGDEGANEALWELVYPELKRMASSRIAKRRPGETLQATALVHEAWMRLGAAIGRGGTAARTSWGRPPARCATSSSTRRGGASEGGATPESHL